MLHATTNHQLAIFLYLFSSSRLASCRNAPGYAVGQTRSVYLFAVRRQTSHRVHLWDVQLRDYQSSVFICDILSAHRFEKKYICDMRLVFSRICSIALYDSPSGQTRTISTSYVLRYQLFTYLGKAKVQKKIEQLSPFKSSVVRYMLSLFQ